MAHKTGRTHKHNTKPREATRPDPIIAGIRAYVNAVIDTHEARAAYIADNARLSDSVVVHTLHYEPAGLYEVTDLATGETLYHGDLDGLYEAQGAWEHRARDYDDLVDEALDRYDDPPVPAGMPNSQARTLWSTVDNALNKSGAELSAVALRTVLAPAIRAIAS